MSYWQLYYHMVWATHQREPLLTKYIQPRIYGLIAEQCKKDGGFAFAVNGIDDHVHVIAAMPPSVALSDVVSRIKGVSSRFVSAEFDMPFAWQRGYGIFSVSKSSLDGAIDYVKRQKEHHAKGTTFAQLERFTSENEGPSFYHI